MVKASCIGQERFKKPPWQLLQEPTAWIKRPSQSARLSSGLLATSPCPRTPLEVVPLPSRVVGASIPDEWEAQGGWRGPHPGGAQHVQLSFLKPLLLENVLSFVTTSAYPRPGHLPPAPPLGLPQVLLWVLVHLLCSPKLSLEVSVCFWTKSQRVTDTTVGHTYLTHYLVDKIPRRGEKLGAPWVQTG